MGDACNSLSDAAMPWRGGGTPQYKVSVWLLLQPSKINSWELVFLACTNSLGCQYWHIAGCIAKHCFNCCCSSIGESLAGRANSCRCLWNLASFLKTLQGVEELQALLPAEDLCCLLLQSLWDPWFGSAALARRRPEGGHQWGTEPVPVAAVNYSCSLQMS